MIKADEARKINITLWYRLLYNEYFLMRMFFMKWQEEKIDEIVKDKGYRVFGSHNLKGISW